MISILIVILIGTFGKIFYMQQEKAKLKNRMKASIKAMKEKGCYNYDEYHLGMLNGMELMMATLENRRPEYVDKQSTKFLHSKEQTYEKKINATIKIIDEYLQKAKHFEVGDLKTIKITLLKGKCTLKDLKNIE